MNDQPNGRDAEAAEVRRKVEEVAAVMGPTQQTLRELGYQPTLEANQESGVITMTLTVHVIKHP